jgi:hypothetical protein
MITRPAHISFDRTATIGAVMSVPIATVLPCRIAAYSPAGPSGHPRFADFLLLKI